jgi:hypothetical protein
MKRFIIAISLIFSLNISVNAQGLSVFSATGRGGVATTFVSDYQALGINPANIGYRSSFRSPHITFGFLEGNIDFFAEALTRKEVLDNIKKPDEINFSYEQKQAAAKNLANTAISFDMSMMLFGVSYSDDKLGGFAFSIRDNINFYTKLNSTSTEIAFLGQNASYFKYLDLSNGDRILNDQNVTQEQREQVIIGFVDDDSASVYSELLDGSRISMTWFREYNFGYGRQLIDKYNISLHAGFGVKFIRGIALIDLEAKNNELTASHISMSPTFGLDFGNQNDTTSVTNPTFKGFQDGNSNLKKLLGPKPTGSGFGLDFGMHLTIKKNLHIGVSIINIGKITWDGNVYKINDGELPQLAGAGYDNYNLFVSGTGSLQFAGTKSPLGWVGDNAVKVDLPSTIRVGVSYEFYKKAHVGLDLIVPRNDAPGNITENQFALGMDFNITRNIKLSTGFNTGGNAQGSVNVPLGVTYYAPRGLYEFGLATKDIKTYLGNFNDGSTISFGFGFLRFKFNK